MTALSIRAEPYEFAFDPATTAFLLIDMQRDFLEKDGFGDRMGYDVSLLRTTIRPNQAVLDCARKTEMLIIHTREGFRPDLTDASPSKLNRSFKGVGLGSEGPLGRALVRGERGHDIVEELYPLPHEPVIDKPGHGAFYATELNLILSNHGIKRLIVAGVTTENCIHSTVREAKDRGYECLVLEDCVASYVPELQKAGIEMFKSQGGLLGRVSNSREVIKALSELLRFTQDDADSD